MNLPEPIVSFDSERSQVQFDLGTDGDVDIKWQLQIDQLVASLGAATGAQSSDIAELLWEFCYRRSFRLNWLKEKDWEIESLRLFLEFLNCWEDNQEWWESSFYNQRLGTWQAVWSRYNLSLESCYSLIKIRHYCTPDEVINPEWVEDWQEYELWARGFPSFISFALFRAELGNDGDWYRRVVWSEYAEEEDEKPAELADETSEHTEENTHSEYVVHQCMIPKWFLNQDWYSPAEWHDYLGNDVCQDFDVKR